jgi:uncharacterized membrane protein YfcA
MECRQPVDEQGRPVSGKLLIAGALAVLVGLSLGMLGSGGAIVMLPILVYVAGVQAQNAVSMSLAIVGGTSLIGAITHYRKGHFHPKATTIFSATGIVGAYFGAMLTHLVAQTTLMLIFSALMLVVGLVMLRRRAESQDAAHCHLWRCLLIGLGVGVLTGFLGVGGGFLIVPALVLFAGIPTDKAIGSSLAIIAINSASGFLGHLSTARIDWSLTVGFLIAACVGMLIGNWASSRVPESWLKRGFAWFVIVTACVIAAINVYALLR